MSPFFGCSSHHHYHHAATFDRQQAITELTTEMDKLGYDEINVVDGVDDFLHIVTAIFKRQRNVIGEYRTQTKNFRDVQAFLYAHQDKSREELTVAINDFDKNISNPSEKIGYKLKQYHEASDEIYQQNIELTSVIFTELNHSVTILADYQTQVAEAIVLKSAKDTIHWLVNLGNDDDQKHDDELSLGTALLIAKDQLNLSMQANELIEIEKETIEAMLALQEELEAKS